MTRLFADTVELYNDQMGAWAGTRLIGAGLITASVAVAVLATVAVLAYPLPALIAVAALGSLALSIFAPKVFFAVGLVAVIASATAERIVGGGAIGFADEAVVLLAVVVFSLRRLLQGKSLVIPPGTFWFAGFAAVGVISAIFQAVPTLIAAQGALLAVKAVLFAFAAAQLQWQESDLRAFVKYGSYVASAIVLLAAVNFVIPRPWAQAILGYPSVDLSFGVPTLIGPFVHPAAFGRMCAIIAIAAFAYRLVVAKTRWSTAFMIFGVVGGILSFRVKTLVGLIASLGYLRGRSMNAGVLLAAFALLPVTVLLLWDPLSSFIGSDLQLYVFQDSARSTVSFGSLDVASHYFPFGAGFGRYGSFIAASNYSPEYVARGFQNIYGLGSDPGEGNFLTDTQWPAIVGEAGWLGAVLFAGGLVRVFVSLRRDNSGTDSAMVTWVRLTGSGWFVLFLIESIAAPAYVSAPAYPFAFLMTGILASIAAQRSRDRLPDDSADHTDHRLPGRDTLPHS